jgi:hypothetical protein
MSDNTTLKKLVIDATTGEESLIDLTAEELAERSAKEIELVAAETEAQAEAEAKAATRQALLTRLGITEDEAKILLGGN